MSAEFRMSIPALRKRPLNANLIAARAVNGQMLDTLGTITATLHLSNNSWQHVFYVLRGFTQAALLVLDFLVANRALLDFARGRLQLWVTSITFLSGMDLIPECCNVSIATALTTPPPQDAGASKCVPSRAHGSST